MQMMIDTSEKCILHHNMSCWFESNLPYRMIKGSNLTKISISAIILFVIPYLYKPYTI